MADSRSRLEQQRYAGILFDILSLVVIDLSNRAEDLELPKGVKETLRLAAELKKGADPVESFKTLLQYVAHAWREAGDVPTANKVAHLNLAEARMKYPVERTMGNILQAGTTWCVWANIDVPKNISGFFKEVAQTLVKHKGKKPGVHGLEGGHSFCSLEDLAKILAESGGRELISIPTLTTGHGASAAPLAEKQEEREGLFSHQKAKSAKVSGIVDEKLQEGAASKAEDGAKKPGSGPH